MGRYNSIVFEVDGAVATLTMNDAVTFLACETDLFVEFLQAMQRVEQESQIRALVVTSSGSAFDVGTKGEVPDSNKPDIRQCIESIRSCRVPVVIAVNGPAQDWGCALALSGDWILAAASAHFAPPVAASAPSDQSLSAEEALHQGLVNECLKDEELMSRARSLAVKLARGPTRALVMTRQLVDEAGQSSFEEQYRRELEVNQELRESVDGREGVQAFLEKREARFLGE